MFLEVKNIRKTYGNKVNKFKALDNCSMSVNEGEFIAIMGKSGSGKSTLLNMIGCVDLPTEGEIIWNDEVVNPANDDKMSNHRMNNIGFVFQDFKLLPEYSVMKNIALPFVIAGEKIDEGRIDDFLKKFGLLEKKYENVENLSGGQKQRVAIIRAVVNNPKLLLCDEPTGALDSENARDIIQILRDLNKQGMTIIMVTHDRTMADCADKIIEIIDGRIVTK